MLVKICGLKRAEDVREAVELGVDFCGFIFHPQSPRAIAPARAAELDSGDCRRVGVFVEQGSEEILGVMDAARLDFAQLHGRQSVDCALRIGAEKVIRVLWPERFASVSALQAEIDRHARTCAWYLLDAGKRGGGSGRHLDWDSLRELRFPHPWLLAGGLSAATLPAALQSCRPDGVDLNSGIEVAPGVKDVDRLREAVLTARA
ncbi:MAG: phosphoribosylanthranilate isomerase [Desulfovibrio sp.]|uniref:phosphoribosylanthranilate isomerase n=1 Tax=Desulfovibrio sp. TaxID=885 RepID=UPI0025BF0D82|nr:phosphoribosylanthranilate isomerase [Desulfovibrio sp.]MCI7568269.1 phosphoribosylanthranilate isomerase [Desulfovibrio sp.]